MLVIVQLLMHVVDYHILDHLLATDPLEMSKKKRLCHGQTLFPNVVALRTGTCRFNHNNYD